GAATPPIQPFSTTAHVRHHPLPYSQLTVRRDDTISTSPATTATAPATGGSGMRSFSCEYASIGPTSTTFSRFVYVMPPYISATMPRTTRITPKALMISLPSIASGGGQPAEGRLDLRRTTDL